MTLLRFDLAPYSLQFERGSSYPTEYKDEVVQAQDRSAGGELKVENHGVLIKQITLQFVKMSRADYEALVNWFTNVSVGAMRAFQVTDEYGETYQAKIISRSIKFPEIQLNKFTGSIQVEKV